MMTENPLKQYRTKHGFTQSDLADALGLSQTMIALIESGDRQINPLRCRDIETATNGELSRYILRPDIFGEKPKRAVS